MFTFWCSFSYNVFNIDASIKHNSCLYNNLFNQFVLSVSYVPVFFLVDGTVLAILATQHSLSFECLSMSIDWICCIIFNDCIIMTDYTLQNDDDNLSITPFTFWTCHAPARGRVYVPLTLNLGEVLWLPQSIRCDTIWFPREILKGDMTSAYSSLRTLTLGTQPSYFEEARATQERLYVGVLATSPH